MAARMAGGSAHPPRAEFVAGHLAFIGSHHAHPARLQHGHVGDRRRMQPHPHVHRRRHQHRLVGRQQQRSPRGRWRGRPPCAPAGPRSPAPPPADRRCATARCGPSRSRRSARTARCRHGLRSAPAASAGSRTQPPRGQHAAHAAALGAKESDQQRNFERGDAAGDDQQHMPPGEAQGARLTAASRNGSPRSRPTGSRPSPATARRPASCPPASPGRASCECFRQGTGSCARPLQHTAPAAAAP